MYSSSIVVILMTTLYFHSSTFFVRPVQFLATLPPSIVQHTIVGHLTYAERQMYNSFNSLCIHSPMSVLLYAAWLEVDQTHTHLWELISICGHKEDKEGETIDHEGAHQSFRVMGPLRVKFSLPSIYSVLSLSPGLPQSQEPRLATARCNMIKQNSRRMTHTSYFRSHFHSIHSDTYGS